MQSEFYHVSLDQLRYSLVWEDARTLREALDIQPDDHVLVITSAGCNGLNALLENPRYVTAIDLNPVQNDLLLLKIHAIRHHEYGTLRGLMGFDGPVGVAAAWQSLERTLPADQRQYWEPFFARHPAGLATAGRLERYLTGFFATLDAVTQARVRRLSEFGTLGEQVDFFERNLHGTDFQEAFTTYFDRANLSQGRDPKLFRYATESGGAAFYARLRHFLGRQIARDSFYLRFFFFGAEGLPEALLPPCYQRLNYETLRQQLPKLRVVTGEALDFLQSAAGQTVTKASLSNIFEYASPEEFRRVVGALFERSGRPLRAVYWNLLQNQGATDVLPFDVAQSDDLSAREGCFYFRNVRVLDSRLTDIPIVPQLPSHESAQPA